MFSECCEFVSLGSVFDIVSLRFESRTMRFSRALQTKMRLDDFDKLHLGQFNAFTRNNF